MYERIGGNPTVRKAERILARWSQIAAEADAARR
jgi:hypothetical protein